MRGQRVSVHTRATGRNLFARLSESLVQVLRMDESLKNGITDNNNSQFGSRGRGGWFLSDQSTSLSVRLDFLPLAIRFDNGQIIYTSFNGGIIDEEDSLNLPECIIPRPIDDASSAIVRAIPFIADALSLSFEPINAEDWELIEIHAADLESGSLLRQISVVYPDQVIPLRVGRADVSCIRVLRWAGNNPCYRLVENTEVKIIPKPRTVMKDPQPSPPLRVYPVWDDLSQAVKSFTARLRNSRLPLPCCSAAVNGETLNALPGWNEASKNASPDVPIVAVHAVDAEGGKTRNLSVLRVYESSDVPTGFLAIDRLSRHQLGLSPLLDRVRLQIINQLMEEQSRNKLVDQIQEGNARVTLRFVKERSLLVDLGSKPWLYPSSNFGAPPCTTVFDFGLPCNRANLSTSEVPKLKNVPVCHGSLLSLPGSTAVVNFEFGEDDEHEKNGSLNMLRFDDVFSLLDEEQGTSVVRSDACASRVVDDSMLNLIPGTPHVSSSALQEAAEKYDEIWDAFWIVGDEGCGKTHIALWIAAHLRFTQHFATRFMDCRKLYSSVDVRMRDLLESLTFLFREARKDQKSVVILDNLDSIVSALAVDSSQESTVVQQQPTNPVAVDQSRLVAGHLRSLLSESAGSVRLLATGTSRKAMESILNNQHVCFTMSVPSPGKSEREGIFAAMLSTLVPVFKPHESRSLDIAKRTEGYRARDLEILALRMTHYYSSRTFENAAINSRLLLKEALNNVLEDFVPLSRRGLPVTLGDNSRMWSDIGGLTTAKKQLADVVFRPLRYRRIYDKCHTRLPRGILLFGPSGCGKSILVPALARECQLALITCHGPELLDRYIGASEAKVRQLFMRAYASAPSVLFLDEFEALAPRRGSDLTGVTDRIVNQLLTFLDGVETTAKYVYIIAATSRPEVIDPAILRPGRLEKHIYVGLPDSTEEWQEILLKLLDRHQIEPELLISLENGDFLDSLDARSVALSFSGADMKGAVDSAFLLAVHDALREGINLSDVDRVTIGLRHMTQAFNESRPSFSLRDRATIEESYGRFADKGHAKKDLLEGTLKTSLR